MGGDTMQLEPSTFYPPSGVAALLRVHEGTLRVWRRQGIGPTFVRIGPRKIVYRGTAILAWLNERTTSSHDHGASQPQRGA